MFRFTAFFTGTAAFALAVPAITLAAASPAAAVAEARLPAASTSPMTAESLASPVSPAVTVLVGQTTVPVLMYHRVTTIDPGPPTPRLNVTPDDFAAQMEALHAAGWHTITAKRLGTQIKNHAVITFDDGRDNGYVNAYPILREYGFVATFYVITGRIGDPLYMSWTQAATMAAHGMEIANHTVSHVDVRSYHGTSLATQVNQAAATIETRLAARGVAARVRTFAYPYGKTSTEAHDLLKARHYTLAVTTASGKVSTGRDPLYAPRIRVWGGESGATLLAAIR